MRLTNAISEHQHHQCLLLQDSSSWGRAHSRCHVLIQGSLRWSKWTTAVVRGGLIVLSRRKPSGEKQSTTSKNGDISVDILSSTKGHCPSITAMQRSSAIQCLPITRLTTLVARSRWTLQLGRGGLRYSYATAQRLPDYPRNHQKIQQPENTHNFLNNQLVPSKASSWIDLHDPATNNLVTRVPQSTDEELAAAVDSAKRAFSSWKATSLLQRQQFMFRFVSLIRENWDRLAASITLEQGKTFADAKGDVLRGLQVAETTCGITSQLTGEVLEVSKDMETRSYREPLGIVAAICPFSENPSIHLIYTQTSAEQR